MDVLSIEPTRTKAYSTDIRWRMIDQRCALRLSYREIGENLNVNPSTVQRVTRLYEETGTVISVQGSVYIWSMHLPSEQSQIRYRKMLHFSYFNFL